MAARKTPGGRLLVSLLGAALIACAVPAIALADSGPLPQPPSQGGGGSGGP
jgi:hypothetical protein